MTIEGWIALNKFGLILGSFRANQDEVGDAAGRLLRLLGGPHLIAGFRLVKATLVIDDAAGIKGASTPRGSAGLS